MDIEAKTIIVIDGKRLYNFEHLTLVQKIQDHHYFEIFIDQDEIEQTGHHTIDESKKWLGKSLVINMQDQDFMGTVTNVNLKQKDGFNGKLVVKGYSKTILMDSGKYKKSWLKKSISAIVKESVGKNIDAYIKPENDYILRYESQYDESNFQFINRLSKNFSEWFFYDGLKINFGKPKLEEALDIAYGESITEISLDMEISSHSPSIFAYNAIDDVISESKPKDNIDGLNELGAHAYVLSKEVYPTIPRVQSNVIIQDKYELDQAVAKTQAAASAKLHTITCVSSDKRLGVGTVINIKSAKYDNKAFEEKPYGIYIITEITHTATGGHAYSNEFKAIPGGVNTLPVSKIELPQATTQIAKVVSVEDPKKAGRIQVEYFWMNNGMRSDWLRVLSLSAGSSDAHKQNRGLVFVPEVGDQVLVDFFDRNPNQAFVAGSFFTGKTGAGGKDKNGIKSITTRSGHLMEFNDIEKAESIKITDKNDNLILMDTVNGTIMISAPKGITVASKEINILGEDKVHIESKEITIVGTDKIIEKSDSSIEVDSPKIISTSDTTSINAKQTIDIEAKQMTNVKGTTAVNLN